MIDWTYTHFRVLMRLLAPRALLYTDMQTPDAIKHNPIRSLHFHPIETPLALQVGGSHRQDLICAAQLAERQGYQEVNLNLGCPSDRVQAGRFGACLMAEPAHVVDCIKAMKDSVSISVTAKTRIGIDHNDSYAFFSTFVHHIMDAGCDKLIVHARKAWLHGLSPKQNRTIPPIHYDYVYRIKHDLPTMPVVINGNITTMDDITTHLQHVDGVMLGRLACQNPYAIAIIHHELYPEVPLLSRQTILHAYVNYLKSLHDKRLPMSIVLKPLVNMAHGLVGARRWKAALLSMQRTQSFHDVTHAIDRLTTQVDSLNVVD